MSRLLRRARRSYLDHPGPWSIAWVAFALSWIAIVMVLGTPR
jgi:hypothetical protein